MNSVHTIERNDSASLFFVGTVIFLVAAATVSACAPIALSMAIVFLFAGPHNWIEFRYFLSRLPARFGKLKRFFAWAFGGVAFLTLTKIALAIIVDSKLLSIANEGMLFACWNSAVILWVLRLIFLTAAQRDGRDWSWAAPAALLLMAVNWLNPSLFGVALVYLHPMIGMWILDRELARSKPAWRGMYHICLAAVALLVGMIWWQLHDAPLAFGSDAITGRILFRAGAGMLPVSSRLLVATHTFLETVHYAIWLIIIPLASAGWQSFRPRSIPITCRSAGWKKAIASAFVLSSFAVAALWVAFGLNFGMTTDIYFTIAIAHVLAEIPFLLKGVM